MSVGKTSTNFFQLKDVPVGTIFKPLDGAHVINRKLKPGVPFKVCIKKTDPNEVRVVELEDNQGSYPQAKGARPFDVSCEPRCPMVDVVIMGEK